MNKKNLNLFKKQISKKFSLRELLANSKPITVSKNLDLSIPKGIRLNHYLIKLNHSEKYALGELEFDSFKEILKKSVDYCKKHSIDTRGRYCFVTLDQGFVSKNQTLRDPGWHLDGLQGDEVKHKKNADFQFIWSNTLPTIFYNGKLDPKELSLSQHNIFNALGKQVNPKKEVYFTNNSLLLMNPYHLHRAMNAKDKVYRKFIRISFTKCPVTSVRMSINKNIKYNYPIHITSGAIPKHLK